jgi:hypothetical protein
MRGVDGNVVGENIRKSGLRLPKPCLFIRRWCLTLATVTLLFATAVGAETPVDPGSAANAKKSLAISKSYGNLPLSFEANRGQVDPQVRFLSRGKGYSLFLTDRSVVLALRKPEKGEPIKSRGPLALVGESPAPSFKTDVIRMGLVGMTSSLEVTGADELPGTANYFIGNDPKLWKSNVPTFGKIAYSGVYPGVDLVYYGKQQQLEYDFIVSANARPEAIRLHFDGVRQLRLDGAGDLRIIARDGEVAFHKPVVYQDANGQRQLVEGHFKLMSNNTVGFTLGPYDHSKSLVIDPALAYSTYLGGSTYDEGHGITVDGSNSAYITGETYSTDFPLLNAYQSANKAALVGASSVFVSKLSPDGSTLVYSTYIGGSGNTNGEMVERQSP